MAEPRLPHHPSSRRATLARHLTRTLCGLAAGGLAVVALAAPAAAQRPRPIVFVTQVPIPRDFGTAAATFGNHLPPMDTVGRGGDLWLLMPNDTLKNLTALAGFGVASGFQGANAIAVRDPSVDWTGSKVLFSMVIGAPTQRYQVTTYYWRIYELTNLDQVIASNATPVIQLVPNQPVGFNNITPVRLPSGRIAFTSDRPRNGAAHLYPQRDEYEEAAVVSGIWSIDPAIPGGGLELLDHSPSGDFTPILDSYGRIIFTRWDHLQRDQQADADHTTPTYGTYDWSSEAANSVPLANQTEVFPEPRSSRLDLLGPCDVGHTFNQFFPWMMNQDGSELETVNHVGRHELATYFEPSIKPSCDPNMEYLACGGGGCPLRPNQNSIVNLFHLRERPLQHGTYIGIDAGEFGTHTSGQVVQFSLAPGANPDNVTVTYVTDPETRGFDNDSPPAACHSGLYRNPLVLSDAAGTVIVSHSGERVIGGTTYPETRESGNDGTGDNDTAFPDARYDFRLRPLVDAVAPCAGYKTYGAPLTPGGGIVKTLDFWSPDVHIFYNAVAMWELQPVEVPAPAAAPPITGHPPLAAPEAQAFVAAGVSENAFRAYLTQHDLALIVSRNVTTRDRADRQQPFNLHVPGGVTTTGATGTIYDVDYLQLFQADLLRGIGGTHNPPTPGRRVLARTMHDGGPHPPPSDGSAPAGSVEIATDGSLAALVPAHRAMTWQLVNEAGDPVVRERYWLTFQPGEVRVCASCHGVNTKDQANQDPPVNTPAALTQLLTFWKQSVPFFSDGFESGTASAWAP
jgi:hypothetical protein